MAVILPTGSYRVLRRSSRPEVEDEHGVPVPSVGALAVASVAAPGAVHLNGDGSWNFRLSPSQWPVFVDDFISGDDGSRYVVRTVKLNANVASSALDHIAGICVTDPNPSR